MIRRHKCVRKILEPVRVGICIVIDIGDDLTACRFTTRVARAAQAAILGADKPKWVLPGDFSRVVCRSVVYNNDFIVGVVELL